MYYLLFLMYAEASELDKAERGDSQENRDPKDEASRQANGGTPQRISQPLYRTQEHSHTQCDDIGAGALSLRSLLPS